MEGELCLRSLVSVKDSYKVLCLAWIISVRNCFTADFLDRVNTRTNIYMIICPHFTLQISYKRKMISYVQTSVTLTLKNSELVCLKMLRPWRGLQCILLQLVCLLFRPRTLPCLNLSIGMYRCLSIQHPPLSLPGLQGSPCRRSLLLLQLIQVC
ncbi:uncharacterized protein LOC133383184 isoform X7 [Rhineura floridana]|uniref:uncharacterized protein LOC133383184 isoform X7 n=1 Tax=Rhineura floridana TaxID=261503 RepID=UPI002AC84CF0|nr:uncharacterized protein LOC133383184 isoform X7 [Rhineura floridana]